MGDNEPESQSLSKQVRETARWTRAVCILQGRTSLPGQVREDIVWLQQSRPSGGQCQGRSASRVAALWLVELLSQEWAETCLAYTLERGVLHPFGSLDKCLGTEWGISSGACLGVVPLCRHGCSGHVCRYLSCVSLTDVSNVT